MGCWQPRRQSDAARGRTTAGVRAARRVHQGGGSREPSGDGRHRRSVGRGGRGSAARQASRRTGRRGAAADPGVAGLPRRSAALETFTGRFDEYRRLDDEILPLAVENTNLKAQRLSFGPARRPPTRSAPRSDAAVVPRRTRAVRGTLAASRRASACSRSRSCRRRISPSSRRRDDADRRADEDVSGDARAGAGELTELECHRGRGERSGGAGSLHGDQRGDRRAVAAQQQRALAGAVARPEADGHGGMRRRPAALEEALAKHEFTATR